MRFSIKWMLATVNYAVLIYASIVKNKWLFVPTATILACFLARELLKSPAPEPVTKAGPDFSEVSAGSFAIVLSERDTGIVINADTMERWRESEGGRISFVVETIEAARELVAAILAERPDLEATIYNDQGAVIERVNWP